MTGEKSNEVKRRFGCGTYPNEILKGLDLSDKTIVITGTTNGIGVETAKALAQAGAHIVMANRNLETSKKVRNEICETTHYRKIDIVKLDLSSLKSVEEAAKEILEKKWPIHALILNAGILNSTTPSADGYEPIFATNHLGGFYFTQLLQDRIIESAPSRIVVLSSKLHRYTMINSNSTIPEKLALLMPPADSSTSSSLLYARSKLCNALFAIKLHRNLHSKGVNVYSLHPGVLFGTNLYEQYGIFGKIMGFFAKPFLKNLEQGASTTIYCAVSEDTKNQSGKYYEDCWSDKGMLDKELAQDEKLQDALWEKTEEIIEKFKKDN